MPDNTASLVMDELTKDEESDFEPQRLSYFVEVLSGAKQGTKQAITTRMVVGSTPEADLLLSDATVSRRHALLDPTPRGVWVRDLTSKNGTFLRGNRVDAFLVRRETTFSVGSTLLRVAGMPAEGAQPTNSFGRALGATPQMKALFTTLARVAPTSSSVLLLGETGTGKEVLARAIHEHSARRHRPFVTLDCSALPPNLAESELFGHAKGAFTGADKARLGAFASADGGTLFLDEVGELPLDLQPKLLRVLESRMVHRVGDDAERAVDVRIVAATHRDLEQRTTTGEFRRDLFFRLAVVVAHIPSLRERRDDIPLLAESMLAALGRPDVHLTSELMASLQHHTWPGNVRELRNLLERLVCGVPIDVSDGSQAPQREGDVVAFKDAKEQMLESFTRDYFTQLFKACDGNIAELARRSGLARTYAHEVVKKLGLKR